MDHTVYRLMILGIFLVLLLLALLLMKRRIALPVVFIVAVSLGIYRAFQFAYFALDGQSTYPIEISHIAYFTQAGILLSGIPQLQFFAGFLSTICAIGYFIGAMVSPTSMMSGLDSFTIIQGMVIHGILLFCGLVMLFGIRRYKKRALIYSTIGILLILLFAFLVKKEILYPGVPKGSYVVLKMVDGTLLSYIFPNMVLTPLIQSLTTIFLLVLAFLLSLACYAANHSLFRYYEPDSIEWGIYPWIRHSRSKRKQ